MQVLPAALEGKPPEPEAIMMGFLAGGQVCFAIVTVVGGALSRESFRQRLGLVVPSFPWWGWIAIPVGAWIPAELGLLLATPLPAVFSQGAQFAKFWETASPLQAAAFVATVALLPGTFEELLFRGYVQRRLLQRWKPAVAITVTSAFFAACHVEPSTVVFAFPIGLWLGVLAWRTGSVLPGMVAHAFINGTWNIFQMCSRQGFLSDRGQHWTIAVALIAAGAAFFGTLRIIRPVRGASEPGLATA
jgi:membrane protease YdiL (CAAX protease family)